MYQGFNNGAWSWLQNITLQYTQKYNQLNVMNGAIFDYDADGLADSIELIKSKYVYCDLNSSINYSERCSVHQGRQPIFTDYFYI